MPSSLQPFYCSDLVSCDRRLFRSRLETFLRGIKFNSKSMVQRSYKWDLEHLSEKSFLDAIYDYIYIIDAVLEFLVVGFDLRYTSQLTRIVQ